MGFEDKGARCGRRTAPPSLEENYRRWLRSMRDRIDSELAGEERAVEWLRKTLPRLEEDYTRLYRKRADEEGGHLRRRIRPDDEMIPEESKLQMLKDSVLDTMLREAEAEDGARRIREEAEERLRRMKRLVATGVLISSSAVPTVSAVLIPSDDISVPEFLRFMCLEAALSTLYGVSLAVRDHLRPPLPSERPMMNFCSDLPRPRVGLMELLPN